MPRQPTEATARALVLVASGRSVQEAATAAGIAVSTLNRAMKRTGVTTNRRRSRRTAIEMQAAKAQAQALAVEREARPPKAPTRTALQRLHWLQTELEQQGRKEAADLRAVLDWVERKKPSR